MNLRLTFTTDEILANVDTREPLIVKGVKCHGGLMLRGIPVAAHSSSRAGYLGVAGAACCYFGDCTV